MMKDSTKQVIQESELFSGLSFPKAFSLEAKKGQTLSDLAENCVILVVSGKFEVLSESSVILSTLSPGNCFGINSLYLNNPQMGTLVYCQKKGSLLCVPREDFRRHLEKSPEVMAKYLTLCNEKIHFLLSRIQELTVPSALDRVFSYLKVHADSKGDVRLKRSKESLAKLLNMSRAAVFIQFKTLKEEGLITETDKVIHLETKHR